MVGKLEGAFDFWEATPPDFPVGRFEKLTESRVMLLDAGVAEAQRMMNCGSWRLLGQRSDFHCSEGNSTTMFGFVGQAQHG